MGRKGFTLVELLGVIVILSIIMAIAIPNITSVLDKNKKTTYIADAKKFVSLVQYELGNGTIEKPTSTQLVRIPLSVVDNTDVTNDPNGTEYSKTDSYVVVARIDGYLEYYVNLKAIDEEGRSKGIRLVHIDDLDTDRRLSYIVSDFANPSNEEIKTITGVNGTIIEK